MCEVMNKTETKNALSKNLVRNYIHQNKHSVAFYIYNIDGNVKEEEKWYLQIIYIERKLNSVRRERSWKQRN